MRRRGPGSGPNGDNWQAEDHTGRASMSFAQGTHGLPGQLEVADIESSRNIWAFRPQAIVQPARIPGTTVGTNYKPVFDLIPGIPSNRCLSIDAFRQVEFEPPVLQGDGIATGQARGPGHVA